jgi:hypothetical protein
VRVTLLCLTIGFGVAAVALALLMPAHLRATDPHVIARLGGESRSLVQLTAETASHNPAVAKILLAAAETLKLTGTDAVVEELRSGARDRTRSRTVLEQLEAEEAGRIQVSETPVLTALRKAAGRERLRRSLQGIEAKQVLRNVAMTNLVIFAPVRSAAGLPLEVAILTTAFLLEQRAFPPSLALHDQVLRFAGEENGAVEELYLSILALAKRFSSEQIIALVANIPDANSLHAITGHMQEHPGSASLIYTAVIVSKDGGAVANYLNRFAKTAEEDLRFALTAGVGGAERLLRDQQPVYRCSVYESVSGIGLFQAMLRPFVSLSAGSPGWAVALKLSLLGIGGFLLASSVRFRKPVAKDSPYVFYPRFSLIRRGAFAAVFLMLAIVIGEPYLAQGEPKEPRVRVSFPLFGATGSAPPVTTIQKTTPMIDPQTLIAMATFLVLQVAIYAVCLAKLAEIRKQPVSNWTKLKLLDNEDNLFDGGLYCGLFGTAGSLILLTIGAIKPSLVSAYSSTLFGILFVALLKIGHVRPLKRRLLLEASDEAEVREDKIVIPSTAPKSKPAEPGTATPRINPFA